MFNIVIEQSPFNMVLFQGIVLGLGYMIPYYAQEVGGYNEFMAGCLLLPGCIIGAVLAPMGGRLLDAFGARKPIHARLTRGGCRGLADMHRPRVHQRAQQPYRAFATCDFLDAHSQQPHVTHTFLAFHATSARRQADALAGRHRNRGSGVGKLKEAAICTTRPDAQRQQPTAKLLVHRAILSGNAPQVTGTTRGTTMNVKQQKDIEQFLSERLGNSIAPGLFARQSELLEQLVADTHDKSASQMKELEQTILPRVALYKALVESALPHERAFELMRAYMMDVVAAEKHASTAKMEAVPGFFGIYKRVFLHVMRTSDLWESTQAHGRDFFDASITKCLWHTACVESGCPELCPLFCDVDDVNYGGLSKMGFSRTKTLGYGGDCCDFHFYRR